MIGIQEWCVFKALFELTEPLIRQGTKSIQGFDDYDFFMKIRLNLFEEDIAYRCGVHVTTVSRIFHHVLDIMYVKTKPFIKWPDCEVL